MVVGDEVNVVSCGDRYNCGEVVEATHKNFHALYSTTSHTSLLHFLKISVAYN